MAARSSKIKPLIAAMPGYINPVRLAKMISTFQRMSGGRICINLIAGQNKSEVEAEGVRYGLSGHLHDEEAERFGRLVRPILAELNRGRLAA